MHLIVRCLSRVMTALLLILLPAAFITAESSHTSRERPHVLVLLSYHHFHSWSDRILQGIHEWGGATPADKPVIYVEWMDTKRHPSERYQERLAQHLHDKHTLRPWDVVLTVDDNALAFAAQHDELFGGTPIICSGINGNPDLLTRGRDGVTGILERFDIHRNLLLARTLHGEIAQVVFITADDENGRALQQMLGNMLAGLPDRPPAQHWAVSSIDELPARLPELDMGTLIFTLGAIPARSDQTTLEPEEVVDYLRNHTPLPIYSDLEAAVGRGAVGGYVNDGLATGRMQAAIARRVLGGESPDAIPPVSDSPLTPIFDYRELQRLGLDEDKLPADSVVLHAPPSIFDSEYRNLALGAAAALCILLLAVAALAVRNRIQASRQAALRYQATHDDLTGLPNRAWLNEFLQRPSLMQPGDRIALVMMDLNRFKLVNDTYGHAFGDEVIISVTARLYDMLVAREILARFSGDAFVIVSRYREDGELAELQSRCLAALDEPFEIRNRRVALSAALGMATDRAGGADYGDMLRRADIAMYEASRKGGLTQMVVFDDKLQEHTTRRLMIESSLPAAIAEHRLHVLFQPIVEADTGQIVGFETLSRWRHPELGLIPPPEFIHVATESGMIADLTRAVLSQACREFRPHLSAPHRPYLSVNVSASDIHASHFPAQLADILTQQGVPAERLVLEVTEDMLLSDTQDVLRSLARLRELGVRIAIDDFGTGYASMSYLSTYMVNIVKIDQSFVRNILDNPPDQKIVRAIVSMAADLDLEVVTEGVETPEQVAVLRKLDCRLLQGYVYSQPRPPADWTGIARIDTQRGAA